MKKGELIAIFLSEVDRFINFEHGCTDPECDAYDCDHPQLWDVKEQPKCIFEAEDLIKYINSPMKKGFFKNVVFSDSQSGLNQVWGTNNLQINYKMPAMT